MTTIQAYRFALDLTPGQERDVYAHTGAIALVGPDDSAEAAASAGRRVLDRAGDDW